MHADAARIEEAGLNALQTQRQLFCDGWLLRMLACGQVAIDADLADIYDRATAADSRRCGLASAIVDALLARACEHGTARAFLQVSDDNAAALAVYRKFGFATAYAYHYGARAGECR